MQIGFALKGGGRRKKDLRLNAVAGIAEGRKLRDNVTRLMQDADAHPEDAMVYCVVANPDLAGGLDAREITIENGSSDLALATQLKDKLPIGYLIFVWDKAAKNRPIFGHARPLIVEDPRSLALNERALAVISRNIEERLGIRKSN